MNDADQWVLRVLGLDVAAAAAAGPAGGALDAAVARWSASRADVLKSLKALESAIRDTDDPLAAPAIILLRSVSANLTARPGTEAQLRELRRYLETDSVIDDAETPNGFGIDVSVRKPLLAALDGLDQAMAA